MSQKRKNPVPTQAPAAPEAEAAPAAIEPAPANGSALIWKLAGGALLVVTLLVGTNVYLQMQRQVRDLRKELGQLGTELRQDLARLHESYGTMVKKNDHDGRVRQVWDSLKELRADRSDLTMLKERCSTMLEMLKSSDEERKQLAGDVRQMRERKASEEERQALTREIRALRERIAQIESGKMAGHAEEQEKP